MRPIVRFVSFLGLGLRGISWVAMVALLPAACGGRHAVPREDGDVDADTVGADGDADADVEADVDEWDGDGCRGLVFEGDYTITGEAASRALAGYVEVTGALRVSTYRSMELWGLDCLARVGRELEINETVRLESLDRLGALESVGADFIVRAGGSELHDLSGLTSLRSIGENLELSGTSGLESLTGLEGLTEVPGCVFVWNHEHLAGLDGLGNVREIGECLSVVGNEGLTSLAGLRSLESVGSVEIRENGHLTSLGLDALVSMTGDLQIGDNRALPVCEIELFVERLRAAGWSGTAEVWGNSDLGSCE